MPAVSTLLLQTSQPFDEHLRPLGTREVMFHPRRDEIANAVAAFFVEIEAGGDAELFQVGDDVGSDLDGLVSSSVDEKHGR